MRLKRSNAGRVCVHVSLVIVSVMAFTAAPALALNPERHYEQVSPEFKGGSSAGGIVGVAPDGESVAFGSLGAFAGSSNLALLDDYQATRSGSGWSTVSLTPPSSLSGYAILAGLSPSLESSLWNLELGQPNTAGALVHTTEVQFAVHASGAPDTEAGFQPVGPILKQVDGEPIGNGLEEEGVSDDFCHVVLSSTARPLLPEAVGFESQIYDVSAGCHGAAPSLKIVALNNARGLLSPDCEPKLGSLGDTFNAVSEDGSEIFFEAQMPSVSNCSRISNSQLFVRVGGAKTLEVSKPLSECETGEVPCGGAAARPDALFRGASEDGLRVFFTEPLNSGQPPLVPGDTDSSNNLYMAEIGCPDEGVGCEAGQRVETSLVQVSHDPNVGEPADVQGVVSIAPDGSRVYFVARGVLGEGANQQGVSPVKGADNLYVYENDAQYPAGSTVFIGDLCSGPGLSGVAQDVSCPTDLEATSTFHGEVRNDTNLWLSFPYSRAQTAGSDGRFLVFSTYARLITAGPEADADDAMDVYRYDARTGLLERVSLGEAGHDANGNRNDTEAVGVEGLRDADATIQLAVRGHSPQEERRVVERAVSEDGSRIVFMTEDPLSPAATNGLANVYEWHEGSVSLVSSGSALEPDGDPVITSSGRDLFFATTAGLVGGDTDGLADVYDARIGEGFPVAPAQAEACAGDACQGPLTNPAPLLVPGSVPQAAGGNFAPAVVTTAVKPKPKSKPAKCRRGLVRKNGKCMRRPKKSARGRK
jgi:hypothetical protein